MALSAPRSVWSTVALFAVGAAVFMGARPAGRASLRAILQGHSEHSGRAAGPIASASSERARAERSTAAIAEPVAPALPERWSRRAPSDRGVFAIEHRCEPTDAGASCEGSRLRALFERWMSFERGQRALVRIAHMGDSIVADDKITGRFRQRMQRELGDAGLGWLYAQRPTRWYHPRGVRFEGSQMALASVVDGRSADARYGPGAAAFDARVSGALASVTVSAAAVVRAFALPERAVSMRVDDGAWAPLVDGAATARVTIGAHTINLRGEQEGARVFGVSVERGERGAIVDNLGLVGSSARSLSHQDFTHWEQALRALSLDLVVISLGTNDSSHGPIWPAQRPQLEGDYARIFAMARRAAGSCLVALPPDTAEERGGPLGTRVALPVIIEAQRRAAAREGCAVWDTWRWMGGRNAIVRWRSLGLADGDYTHLTDAGAARIADALADALLAARDELVSSVGSATDGGVEARDR